MGNLVGILLAAGRGSRFGGDKLLHPLPDGTPMGVAAARSLRTAVDRVIAVTRPGDDHLAALLREAGCTAIVAADAAKGMGHSLAAGVKAAPDAAGWLIALGDMPFIQPETHRLVALAVRAGHAIVAPIFNGVRGHPVAFSSAWRESLLALEGDAGARVLVQSAPGDLYGLPVADPGVVQDVDLRMALDTRI